MTTWNLHYHFARNRSQKTERELREIKHAKKDDDDKNNYPEQTPQLPEQPEQMSEQPEGIEGVSTTIRKKLERVRTPVVEAVSRSPLALKALLQHISDPELEQQIHEYLQHIEKEGGIPALSPEIKQRIGEYLADPKAVRIVTQEFEQQRQRYSDSARLLRHINIKKLKEMEINLTSEGRRSLKENDWELKELRAMAKFIGLSYAREWDAETNKRIRDDAFYEQDCLLETLNNKLEAARAVGVIGQHDFGREVDAETLTMATDEFTKQVDHTRKYLHLINKARAREMNNAYKKKLLPWLNKYQKDPEKVQKELGVSVSAMENALINTVAPIQETIRLAGGKSEAKLPDIKEEKRTEYEIALQRKLQESEWLLTVRNDEELEAHLVGTEKLDQKQAREWATCNATRIRRAAERLQMDTKLSEQMDGMREKGYTDIVGAMQNLARFCENIKSGKTEFEDEEQLYDHFSQTAIMNHEAQLSFIENPALQEQFARAMSTEENIVDASKPSEEADRLLADLASTEKNLFPGGTLHGALRHEVCDSLGVESLLRHHILDVRLRLNASRKMKGPKAAHYLRFCAVDVINLLECAEEIKKGITVEDAETLAEYKHATKTDKGYGAYNPKDGKIYINKQRAEEDGVNREKIIHHETGHAIVDLLKRRSCVLPGLFIGTSALLYQEIPDSSGHTFNELLMAQEEDWLVQGQRKRFEDQERNKIIAHDPNRDAIVRDRADARIREHLMDELLNKHASWIAQGRKNKNVSDAEQQLYKMLDATKDQHDASGKQALTLAEPEEEVKLMTDVGDGGADDATGGTTETPQELIDDPTQHFIEINRHFSRVRQFLTTHDELSGKDVFKEWEDWLNNREQLFSEYENQFKERDGNEQQQAKVLAWIKRIRDDAEDHAKIISDYEQEELNITNVPSTGREGLAGIFGNVQFLCVYDIYSMVMDAGEDINRLWKRRGERSRSMVGKALTEWIPEWIDSPLYLGKLQHEFKRRNDQSELDEVKQWKEAFENTDSYALQEMLGTTTNKDQLRAIIELLSERGRLDWNDKKFWKRLNKMSNYKMPIDACKNNDLLRDQWLQKLITDIWNDKEHYNNWRRDNDGKIKSKKDEWTPKVDQLANVGAMDSKLESMLRTYVEASDTGRPIPEEVDPHLYEELLHYAIRLGKMSMEAKFFYLIQGVRYGILSIDRLRVLAGDGGGVLMIFPYIDYFYGKNNSMPEIVALGEKLDEGRSRPDVFSPGLQTTMFVRTKLMKEPAAKERLRKAISKRGEEIDHDDIPYFMTDIDWSGVDEWLGVMSGSRQKLSKPALMNIYPGFNMKFKTAAVLASLHRKKEYRLSKGDIAELIQRLIAYIHADNILTKNGVAEGNRPFISDNEYDQRPVVSGAGRTTRQYRNSMNGFAQEVFSEFTDDGFWQDINSKVGTQQGQEVTKDRYVGNNVNNNEKSTAANCSNATAHISTQLQQVITGDSGKTNQFINMLADYGDKFLSDGNRSGAGNGEKIEDYLSVY